MLRAKIKKSIIEIIEVEQGFTLEIGNEENCSLEKFAKMDSIDRLETVIECEKLFSISIDDQENIYTLKELIDIVERIKIELK